jgi:magnesium-transporting ATPase (P-type)
MAPTPWLARLRRGGGRGGSAATATAAAAGDAEAPAAAAAKPHTTTSASASGYDLDDHQLTLEQLAQRYSDSAIIPQDPSASKGLTEDAAAKLRALHGPNALTPPKQTPEIVKFLLQLANPLLLMLLAAGALTYMAYAIQSPRDRTNLILASCLVGVVLLTAAMSWWQERSAGNVMASLGRMMPAQCTVVRRGGGVGGGGGAAASGERRVDAAELVPGDVVRLSIGDRVPADLRIVHSQALKVEMSSLTGESELVGMVVDARHALPAESRNVAFASSLVMNGGGTGVVVRTGDSTMIGQIAGLATATPSSRRGERTTLEREIHRLVVFVAVLATCVALALFVIGLAQVRQIARLAAPRRPPPPPKPRAHAPILPHPQTTTKTTPPNNNKTPTKQRRLSPLTAFVNGFILVIVANVPEGLPATVTSLLSLTALRLTEKNVLVKRTAIIETLGATTIIASDKTGTLTQNRMTVESVWLGGELRTASELRPPPEAPVASLERASLLARRSQLARMSQQAGGGGLGRHSAAMGRSSIRLPTVPQGAVVGVGGNGDDSAAPLPPMLGRTSQVGLARMSRDPASAMAAGRTFRPRGDGTFEMLAKPSYRGGAGGGGGFGGGAEPAAASAIVSSSGPLPAPAPALLPFSVQAFADPSAISWDRSSMLTKLMTIATVCNKAKFAPPAATTGTGATAGAPSPSSSSSSPDDRPLLGDATDCGLLRYGDRLLPSALARAAYKKVFDIPFNSANKFALVACLCAGAPPSAPSASGGSGGNSGAPGEHLLLLKGAPEIVVKKCTRYLAPPPQAFGGGGAFAAAASAGGVERVVDDSFLAAMNAAYERCGSLGERVIGFAYARAPARSAADYHAEAEAADAARAEAARAEAEGDTAKAAELLRGAPKPLYDPSRGFVFAGLVSLVDPPREGVLEAVHTCRAAGIRVAMVTGDHPLTAEAIARKIGLVTLATAREVEAEEEEEEGEGGGKNGGNGNSANSSADDPLRLSDERVGAVVITGDDIRRHGNSEDSEAWWDALLTKPEVVCARTTPQQKLQIVTHLQRLGEVVAVTGDGVNDAPALKKAQIGVAMGKGGSDVGEFFFSGGGGRGGGNERSARPRQQKKTHLSHTPKNQQPRTPPTSSSSTTNSAPSFKGSARDAPSSTT